MQLTLQIVLDNDLWHEVNPRYAGPIHSLIQRYLGDDVNLRHFKSYNHREEKHMIDGKPKGIILLEAKDDSCGYVLCGPGVFSSPAFIEESRRFASCFLPDAPILVKTDAQLRASHIDGNLNVLKQILEQRRPDIEFVRKVIDYQNSFGGLSWRAHNG